MRNVHVEEIQCKTILNRSVMPFSDYTLNAYQGCVFGCSYCYVPVMRGRRGQVDERPWGRWVQVKVNAADVLRRQMQRVAPDARIAIGTATDSWQPIEKRYGVARAILEELAYYPNPVSLLTRSPLLIRDIDILRRMTRVSVGVSIPTFDESARRVFEPQAPAIPGRMELIRRLVGAGIRPTLFWCPILFGVSDSAESVRDYIGRAAELGVRRIVWDTLNYGEVLGAPHMRLLRVHNGGRPAERSLPKPELKREIARWAAHYRVAA